MTARQYVVQTQPCCESIAHGNLVAQGFKVYFPTVIVEIGGKKRVTIMEPLFPSYLFVELDLQRDRWRSVNGTRGVKKLLGVDPEHPTAIPDGALDELKARFAAGEFVRGRNATPQVSAGDDITVERGAFAGQSGICVMSRGERVKILLHMVGGAVEVSLPVDMVARAAQ